MDFLKVIKKRKSIRKFQAKEIEKEKIQKILEIVRQAPSAGNLQAYKIFVVKSKTIKERFFTVTYRHRWAKEAAILFVFCADKAGSSERYGQRGANLYAVQDATIACAYAQLAIVDLNLGSVWIGSFDEERIKKALNTGLIPIAILAAGYPAEDPVRPAKKKIKELSKII